MSLHRKNPFTTKQNAHLFLTGSMLGGFLVLAAALIIYLFGALEWTGVFFLPGELFTGLVFMALIAGAEEFIFRGLILRKLAHHINRWLALLISAALFAGVHAANDDVTVLAVINIFLGGMVFGITYMVSRSIWFPIGMRTAWNFIQGPVLGFPVSGLPFESLFTQKLTENVLINGGPFGLEGSLICTVLFLLFLAVHYKLVNR